MFAPMKKLRVHLARLRERRGSITVLSAAMFPVLLGISGLGVEYGWGLLTRVENQRTAISRRTAGRSPTTPATRRPR